MPYYKQMYLEAQETASQATLEVARLNALINLSDDEKLRELARRSRIVDLAAIARHTRAPRHTPQQWKQRGHLPPVDFPHIAEPLWYERTIIEQFIIPTRRV